MRRRARQRIGRVLKSVSQPGVFSERRLGGQLTGAEPGLAGMPHPQQPADFWTGLGSGKRRLPGGKGRPKAHQTGSLRSDHAPHQQDQYLHRALHSRFYEETALRASRDPPTPAFAALPAFLLGSL